MLATFRTAKFRPTFCWVSVGHVLWLLFYWRTYGRCVCTKMDDSFDNPWVLSKACNSEILCSEEICALFCQYAFAFLTPHRLLSPLCARLLWEWGSLLVPCLQHIYYLSWPLDALFLLLCGHYVGQHSLDGAKRKAGFQLQTADMIPRLLVFLNARVPTTLYFLQLVLIHSGGLREFCFITRRAPLKSFHSTCRCLRYAWCAW